ncbi:MULTISPECIES: hypothetical protein [Halobacterium]|uniref:hypothetical protein n=1 Tax=Halobacterium TaxID=2239 RepID=UPI000AC13901|nr:MULTISPECIES: hypothetical protein [Halobacterium]MCG1003153.1 hypothetical protein [Halobacterium noricense]
MFGSPHVRFLVGSLLSLPLSSILSPPDVFARFFTLAVLVAISYYLSYNDGYDALLGD